MCILIWHDEPDAGSSEAYGINVRQMHDENPVTFRAFGGDSESLLRDLKRREGGKTPKGCSLLLTGLVRLGIKLQGRKTKSRRR